MRTYEVKTGDTLESISTISYGTPSSAELIRSANPHADGGLTTGMVLNIPEQSFGVTPSKFRGTGAPGEVALRIDGITFRFWDGVDLTQAIDSIDQISVSAPFEPQYESFRRAFEPFTYKTMELLIGGEPIYTGTLMNPTPNLSVDARTVVASGYARCGVLNDVTMPIPQGSSRALEYKNMDFKQIAEVMAAPFGLKPVFNVPAADIGPAIRRVAIDPVAKIMTFWKKLARQRGLILANDNFGQPLFQKGSDAPPVQNLEEGTSPLLSVTPQFNAQAYYSHVTAITPGRISVPKGKRHSEVNPFLQGVLRPYVYQAEDTYGADAVVAAKAKLGRMFGNSMQWIVAVAGWNMANGDLWTPNDSINLLAPSAYIYNQTKFLIRRIEKRSAADSETTRLTVVLPGAYSGEIPRVLPWD